MLTIRSALQFAKIMHEGQVDKGGVPYIWHPIRVARRVKNIDEKIVALLHDILEDTDATLEDILRLGASEKIVEAILLLTHQEDITYEEYVHNIARNAIARVVKLADLDDNTDFKRLNKLPKEVQQKLLKKYKMAYDILNNDLL